MAKRITHIRQVFNAKLIEKEVVTDGNVDAIVDAFKEVIVNAV